jgi:cleavage and polyadenylation specificity factor subunit 3
MLSFISLGGAREIGANCYYLNLNGRGILLDSGMHPKKNNFDSLPNYDLIKERQIDSCIISHAHLDHIGSLPITLKNIPYLRPFMTQPTFNLADIMLYNAASVIEKESTELAPYYTPQLIDMSAHTFIPKPFNEEFSPIPFQYESEPKITCEFYKAGHILGAASAMIRIGEYKIFYTGDISLQNQPLIPKAELPDEQVDILILESTLASTPESDFMPVKKLKDNFAKSINRIILNNGSVIIPIFALGKTQEILMTIWELMNKNKIPNADIYTGNMSKKITKLYDVFRYMTRLENPNFKINEIPQKSFPDKVTRGEYFRKPSILLAPSGMVNINTIAYDLMKEVLGRNNFGIFFVGYLDPDSPGYEIRNLQDDNSFTFQDDKRIKKSCTIKSFRFTSHSKITELLGIVKTLKPKKVILIHGDFEGQLLLKQKIELYNPEINVILPEDGVEYELEL